MRKILSALVMFLLAMAFTEESFAHQAEVLNIPSNKYFETTLTEINSAKSSVLAAIDLTSL